MEALTQERAHGGNGYPGSGAGPGDDEEGKSARVKRLTGGGGQTHL